MMQINMNNLNEDKELIKMYQSDAVFNKAVHCLVEGVSEYDLLVMIKDICELKNTYKEKAFKNMCNKIR